MPKGAEMHRDGIFPDSVNEAMSRKRNAFNVEIWNKNTKKIIFWLLGAMGVILTSVFTLGGKYTYVMERCSKVDVIKTDVDNIKGDIRYMRGGMEALLRAQGLPYKDGK